MSETIELTRDCEAIAIPSGRRQMLSKGAMVRIVQARGGTYTISTEIHAMFRIDAKDADALGLRISSAGEKPSDQNELSEELVWNTLKTVYDPELPVNIVDLGLVHSCAISPNQKGGNTIAVRMAMTAPGCGMSNVLKSDVESRLLRLPQVSDANVEVVFDPPWTPARMTEAARLQLGMEMESAPDLIQILRKA